MSKIARVRGIEMAYDDAGHVSNVERTEEFNRALVDFLNGLT